MQYTYLFCFLSGLFVRYTDVIPLTIGFGAGYMLCTVKEHYTFPTKEKIILEIGKLYTIAASGTRPNKQGTSED